MVICKCGKEHDGTFGSGKFCSRACANSRGPRTDDFKKKVAQKLKRKSSRIYPIQCPVCDTWRIERQNRGKYCSKSCANKARVISKETRQKLAQATRLQYKDGRPVMGGRTKWIEYNGIKVQGSYELRTCKILDKWKSEGKIKNWEYTSDRIAYINIDGKHSSYLLDFKVFRNDDSFYYLETKGWETPNDTLKWDAVRNQGFELKIWYNDDIESLLTPQ